MDLDFLLIRKMKLGDEKAFDLFVHKYYKDILLYCGYHCFDREAAQDLTQETFIRFFTKLSDYHHKGKTRNYLYTIAGHLCIDYLKREKEMPAEDVWLAEQMVQGDWEDDTVLNRIALEATLEKLPDELREVIILYYFDDLKIAQIAESLGISVSLVKYRLRQAKLQLKNICRRWDQ